ncbi:MAG: TonB-dependent receptor plug domain-containing protein [Cytophagales bacterium]
MFKISFIFSILFFQTIFSQTIGCLRIKAVDAQSQQPLEYYEVILKGTKTYQFNSLSQVSGFTVKDSIILGTYTCELYADGYEPETHTVHVQSGKACELQINFKSTITELEKVVLENKKEDIFKGNAHTFEAKDFAKIPTSYGDPARIVQNLPSVVSTNDANNQIAVRGNSPANTIYYLEDIEIPNSSVLAGVNGGSLSIFNENSVEKFDFYTGAYPAQFSNSLGGLFNIYLRKGNPIRRETHIKISPLGAFASTEGYFKKKKSGTYIINARVWDIKWLQKTGMNLNFKQTPIPSFRDLTAKFFFNVGEKSELTWSLLAGYGSLENINNSSSGSHKNYELKAYTPIITVLKLKTDLNKNSFINNIISFSNTQTNTTTEYKFITNSTTSYDKRKQIANTQQLRYSILYNLKINNKTTLQSGINTILTYLFSENSIYSKSVLTNDEAIFRYKLSGNLSKLQAYSTLHYRISTKSDLDIGLLINKYYKFNTPSFEPRMTYKSQVSKHYGITFCTGITSRDLPNLRNKEQYINISKKVKPTRSFQISMAHEFKLPKRFTLKTEAFYQYIWNSHYLDSLGRNSLLNIPTNDIFQNYSGTISDKGKGKNYGIEYTISKEIAKTAHIQICGSFYRSLYRDLQKIWQNTAYDNKFNLNVIFSNEWVKTKKYGLKKTILGAKIVKFGGFYSPIVDDTASKKLNDVVFENSYLYTQKLPNYFRIDCSAQINYSRKKVRHEFRLDLQNLTNRKNIYGYQFDYDKDKVVYTYQLGFIPVLSYGIYF